MSTAFTTKGPSQSIASAHINDIQTAINRVEKGTAFHATSTGSSNAYLLALTPAAVGGDLASGFTINFKANFTNTGAATLNLNSLGAVAIKRFSNSGMIDIEAGMIQSGGFYELRHEGTYWCLLNPHQSRWERGGFISTPVGNVGGGTDNGITFTLPANALGQTNQRLTMRWWFSFAANTNSKQFLVLLGATTLYDSTAQTQNDGECELEITVVRTGAATQKVYVRATMGAGVSSFTSTVTYATAAEDLTTDLVVKSQMAGVADDDIITQGVDYTYG